MALSEYAGKVLYFILLSLVFAGIYMALGHENFNGLDESSNFFDYWYFSFTTFSYLIVPKIYLLLLLICASVSAMS